MEILRRYSELVKLDTFEKRFKYLSLGGVVGEDTFGAERYLNQIFYNTKEWKQCRNYVIARDLGRDLGVEGYDILDRIVIHHMNPITVKDVLNRNPDILNPEYLVCTRALTHKAIHYGSMDILQTAPVERRPNDTIPWR